MPNTEGSLVAFHDIKSIENIEVLKTSSEQEWKGIYAYTAHVHPFKSKFRSVDSLLVSMVLKGHMDGYWEVDGERSEHNLHPGSIIIIPPDLDISLAIKSSAEVINIYLSPKLIGDVALDFSSLSSGIHNINYKLSFFDEFLENVIISIKDILYVGGRFSSIEAQYIARVLIARVFSKYSKSSSNDFNADAGLPLFTLQKTFDYIDKNLDRRIVIDKHR